MFINKIGDIFTSKAEAIVNPVNCQGVSGKGLALEFKKRFPQNDDAYHAVAREGLIQIGKMFVYRTYAPRPPYWVVNFPTKKLWTLPSKIEYIDAGLRDLARIIVDRGCKSIALPKIGCGLGGLSWEEVEPLILNQLNFDVRVEIWSVD